MQKRIEDLTTEIQNLEAEITRLRGEFRRRTSAVVLVSFAAVVCAVALRPVRK